jgi:hypothetical protein
MKKLFKSRGFGIFIVATLIVFAYLYLIKPNLFQQKYVTL